MSGRTRRPIPCRRSDSRGVARGGPVRRWRHHVRHRSRGQAVVELALVAPVLLVLLLGAIDLGRVFYSQITITNAARAGAFEAADDPTSFQANGACDKVTNRVMCAAVNESKNSFVAVGTGDVSLTCTPGCTKALGTTASVTVTGHFTVLTPIVWVFTGGPKVTLGATAAADYVNVPAAVGSPAPSVNPSPSASVNPSPSPSASASPSPSPSSTCAVPIAGFATYQQNKNKPVEFTSTSSPTSGPCAITYWRWEFGDSGIDAGNLPTTSHDYALKDHDYTVILSVTNPGGTVSITQVVHTAG